MKALTNKLSATILYGSTSSKYYQVGMLRVPKTNKGLNVFILVSISIEDQIHRRDFANFPKCDSKPHLHHCDLNIRMRIPLSRSKVT